MTTTDKLEMIMSEPTFAEMSIKSAEDEKMARRYAIAVDLDGTLAEYNGWQGIHHIGAPIPEMVEKVQKAHATGKEIHIFTARVSDKEDGDVAAQFIAAWCDQHDIPFVSITSNKHKFFQEFWDDRAIQVIPNTGQFLQETPMKEESIRLLPDEDICKMLGITEKALKVARLMSLPVFNYQHGGSHYKDMLIEPAVFCAANKLDGLQSNVVKYTCRHEFKNGEQDIDKGIHNLQMLKETSYANID